MFWPLKRPVDATKNMEWKTLLNGFFVLYNISYIVHFFSNTKVNLDFLSVTGRFFLLFLSDSSEKITAILYAVGETKGR